MKKLLTLALLLAVAASAAAADRNPRKKKRNRRKAKTEQVAAPAPRAGHCEARGRGETRRGGSRRRRGAAQRPHAGSLGRAGRLAGGRLARAAAGGFLHGVLRPLRARRLHGRGRRPGDRRGDRFALRRTAAGPRLADPAAVQLHRQRVHKPLRQSPLRDDRAHPGLVAVLLPDDRGRACSRRTSRSSCARCRSSSRRYPPRPCRPSEPSVCGSSCPRRARATDWRSIRSWTNAATRSAPRRPPAAT